MDILLFIFFFYLDIVKYICPEGEGFDLGQDHAQADILLQDAQLQPIQAVSEVKEEPSDFELGEQLLLSHAQPIKQETQGNLFSIGSESLLDTFQGTSTQSIPVNTPLSSSQQLQQAVLKLQAVQRQNQAAQQQQKQLQLLQLLQAYQQQQQQQQQKVTLTTDQLKLLLIEYQNRQSSQTVQQPPAVVNNAQSTNKGITLQQLQQVSS